MNNLSKLQEWYRAQCDEDWEHTYGIKIETLDNPGWTIKIDLTDTDSDELVLAHINEEASDDDWAIWWIENEQFNGVGDPSKLDYLIGKFLELVQPGNNA